LAHRISVKARIQKPKIDYRRIAMKTIVSALIAISVLAGVAAAPAAAFDAKTFWQQQDASHGN
jgi:hypothetical protein